MARLVTYAKRCDAYELLDELSAAEPFGRARDVDGQVVALRLAAPDDHEAARPRLEARYRAWTAFSHPNVVPALDRGVDPALGPYLVTAWTDGLAFDQLVPRPHCLGAAETVLLVEPVLAALAALHRAGVTHGDLTADRVRCSVTGDVRLIDPWPLDDRPAPAEDVRAAGALMEHVYRKGDDPALDHLVATCTNDDPGARPADCGVVLERVRRLLSIPEVARQKARVSLITDPDAYQTRQRSAPKVTSIDPTPDPPPETATRAPTASRSSRHVRYAVAALITLASVSTFGLHALRREPDAPPGTPPPPSPDEPSTPTPAPEPALARIPISPDRLSNDDPPRTEAPPPGWAFRDEDPTALRRALVTASDTETHADLEAQLGMDLLRQERTRDAYRSLTRALRDDPDHEGALYAMLDIYQGLELHREAVPLLRRVVRAEPGSAEAWTALSIGLGEAGDPASAYEAARAVDRALELAPGLTPALRQRCLLFSRLERIDAGRVCDDALTASPRDPTLFIARAAYYARIDRRAMALGDLGRAIEVAPTDPRPYAARAQLQQERGDAEAAERDRRRACQLGDLGACVPP